MKLYHTNIKVRMASGCVWVARAKSCDKPRRTFTASSTGDARTAALRCAAKALRAEENEISLAIATEPQWNKPGSYLASRPERKEASDV